MATTSLFVLLDDIVTLLDDIAILSKTATQKTVGVLGDDLALNAEQVSGFTADRELPVVWAVAKGSLINKAILVPMAMLISAFIPFAIIPMLVFGGAYLCYEGFEKVLHSYLHKQTAKENSNELSAHKKLIQAAVQGKEALIAFEKDKIKGAIRTDFILSAEIIVIALGVVSGASLFKQFLALSLIAIAITVLVYGFVALIVRMDDVGIYLIKKPAQNLQYIGQKILWLAPRLLKALTIAGTLAMFLVGGGLLVHNTEFLHHAQTQIASYTNASFLSAIASTAFEAIVGFTLGGIVFFFIIIAGKLKNIVKYF